MNVNQYRFRGEDKPWHNSLPYSSSTVSSFDFLPITDWERASRLTEWVRPTLYDYFPKLSQIEWGFLAQRFDWLAPNRFRGPIFSVPLALANHVKVATIPERESIRRWVEVFGVPRTIFPEFVHLTQQLRIGGKIQRKLCSSSLARYFYALVYCVGGELSDQLYSESLRHPMLSYMLLGSQELTLKQWHKTALVLQGEPAICLKSLFLPHVPKDDLLIQLLHEGVSKDPLVAAVYQERVSADLDGKNSTAVPLPQSSQECEIIREVLGGRKTLSDEDVLPLVAKRPALAFQLVSILRSFKRADQPLHGEEEMKTVSFTQPQWTYHWLMGIQASVNYTELDALISHPEWLAELVEAHMVPAEYVETLFAYQDFAPGDWRAPAFRQFIESKL